MRRSARFAFVRVLFALVAIERLIFLSFLVVLAECNYYSAHGGRASQGDLGGGWTPLSGVRLVGLVWWGVVQPCVSRGGRNGGFGLRIAHVFRLCLSGSARCCVSVRGVVRMSWGVSPLCGHCRGHCS